MSGCTGCAFKGMSTAVEDTFVGVRFREETNLTLCATGGRLMAPGDPVVVELDGTPEVGTVERSPMAVFKPCQKSSARSILRPATEEDTEARERQIENELAGKLYCRERARELGLEMKVSRVDFSLDGKRAIFYFTADGRVDFRRLVRDLAKRFSTRVRMVQVGARDEAGLLGGIGVCGKTLCCSTWLKDFRPISIQMAKRQNLSLNPSKISGQCGRLLCCLAYEDDRYRGSDDREGTTRRRARGSKTRKKTRKTKRKPTQKQRSSARPSSRNPVKWRTAS
jgi:cell fate regulator YaaT (PSP1 superfamily)